MLDRINATADHVLCVGSLLPRQCQANFRIGTEADLTPLCADHRAQQPRPSGTLGNLQVKARNTANRLHPGRKPLQFDWRQLSSALWHLHPP